MSHRIYTTEALVLGIREAGEGTATLILLTEDLGLIYATAQGLRELKSKLRYGLQLYSLAQVSLVKGREVWRLTNSTPRLSLGVLKPDQLQTLARITGLLVRLIRGEEPHPELFAEFRRAYDFLVANLPTDEELGTFELLTVLRLLHLLGYIEPRPDLLPLLTFTDWQKDFLQLAAPVKEASLEVINQALRHSHL